MKKIATLSLLLSLALIIPVNGQVGKFLKNVKNNVVNDVLDDFSGNSKSDPGPEPDCACDDAIIGLDLGKNKLVYTEISVAMSNDGKMLVTNKVGNEYYIVKNGVSQGPIKEGDPRLAEFGIDDEEEGNADGIMLKNKKFISKSGDKYLINFMGQTYGPYARIDQFEVNKSENKFAAWVTENVAVTESQGKSMDERMKNAKTDEEKMALAMEMAQQMQDNIMQSGATGFNPEFVSNIPGASLDFMTTMGGVLNSKVKYDDILLVYPNKITNLNGKTLFTFNSYEGAEGDVFINSNSTGYAVYNYGNMKFSDGKSMSDLFSPYITKEGGQYYLAYMYYSPKKNAIMLCKIPF